jgi:hypothetical protein
MARFVGAAGLAAIRSMFAMFCAVARNNPSAFSPNTPVLSLAVPSMAATA